MNAVIVLAKVLLLYYRLQSLVIILPKSPDFLLICAFVITFFSELTAYKPQALVVINMIRTLSNLLEESNRIVTIFTEQVQNAASVVSIPLSIHFMDAFWSILSEDQKNLLLSHLICRFDPQMATFHKVIKIFQNAIKIILEKELGVTILNVMVK